MKIKAFFFPGRSSSTRHGRSSDSWDSSDEKYGDFPLASGYF